MSVLLRWEAPPPEPRPLLSWAVQVAAELATRPGQWAVVGEYRQPMDAIKPVGMLAQVSNVWTTHRTADRCTTLYACWSWRKPHEPKATS